MTKVNYGEFQNFYLIFDEIPFIQTKIINSIGTTNLKLSQTYNTGLWVIFVHEDEDFGALSCALTLTE